MRGGPSGSCQGHCDLAALSETARQTRPDSSDSPGSSVSRQNKGPDPFGAEPSASDREAGRQGWGGCQPFALSEACSLYGDPGTVHTRKNSRRVQGGDQGDVNVYWLPGPDDGEIGPWQ